MSRTAKPSNARIRTARAKAKDITRRQKDLDTCLSKAHQVALAAALADDYAALLTEYPDVFPTPPIAVEQIRAHAQELREAQAAVEAEEEAEEAKRAGSALNYIRVPQKPEERN
jgi:hypothetical protein